MALDDVSRISVCIVCWVFGELEFVAARIAMEQIIDLHTMLRYRRQTCRNSGEFISAIFTATVRNSRL